VKEDITVSRYEFFGKKYEKKREGVLVIFVFLAENVIKL
jgi:hypothetical protein